MNTKEVSTNSLRRACKMFLQDLNALPEGSFTKSFGGKSRTIADFVYEVNLVNDHIGMVMRGEEPFVWPDGKWIFAPASLDSKEKVIKAFEESSDKIIATCEDFTNEEFESTLKVDDGDTTRAERCRFMAWHVAYHDGQLDFIQALLGDDEMHWN